VHAVKKAIRFVRSINFLLMCWTRQNPLLLKYAEHREAALTQWREEIRRFRLLVAQAEALTPAAFVKRVHEVLPELRKAAMEAATYTYISGRSKKE
jgi:hypothetical protein